MRNNSLEQSTEEILTKIYERPNEEDKIPESKSNQLEPSKQIENNKNNKESSPTINQPSEEDNNNSKKKMEEDSPVSKKKKIKIKPKGPNEVIDILNDITN